MFRGKGYESSLEKINYHPNSAFEVRNRQIKDEDSTSSPGVTKGSLPLWRISQSKTQPILSGYKHQEKSNVEKEKNKGISKDSTKEKSRLFQPWKSNTGAVEQKKSSPFPLEISNTTPEPTGQMSKLKLQSSNEKLSSSSSESERKGSTNPTRPPNKRDSLSDAEGMSGLKRLLRRENSQDFPPNYPTASTKLPLPSSDTLRGIKKSPSAGSTSYWTRISSGQPSFIRKFFEKSSPTASKTEISNVDSSSSPRPSEETAQISLGSNENNFAMSSVAAAAPKSELPESVLSLNVAQKASMFMKLEHEQRFSKWHNSPPAEKPKDRPRSTRFSTQPITTEEFVSAKQSLDDLNEPMALQVSESFQLGNLSSSADVDSPLSTSGLLEPSRLSLKDRVNMFNRMSTVPISIAQSSSGKSFGSNSMINNCGKGTSGALFSKSLNTDSSSSYDNLNGFMSDSKDLRRRRGSDSSVGFSNNSHQFAQPIQDMSNNSTSCSASGVQNTTTKIPIAQLRNTKVKSMFVSQSSDVDNLSEDGEISSGGQEVAEIISRSYENSPIFRKKSWRTQQPQPNLTKELWRKFAKADEVNLRNYTGTKPQGFPPPEINPITSPMFPKLMRAAQPTTSSNLLPILTALSSSDDQLSEANKSSNAPPIKPKRSNLRKILNRNSGLNSPAMPPAGCPPSQNFEVNGFVSITNSSERNEQDSSPSTTTDKFQAASSMSESFSSVKREGDLLIMKKHMPILRRKSSGKSKNPLKVLAARMDFGKQKYTETLMDDEQAD